MRERGQPVYCFTCKERGRYVGGSLWKCARCGGVIFAKEEPRPKRSDWYQKFGDSMYGDKYLQEAVAIALRQKRERIRRFLRPTIYSGKG